METQDIHRRKCSSKECKEIVLEKGDHLCMSCKEQKKNNSREKKDTLIELLTAKISQLEKKIAVLEEEKQDLTFSNKDQEETEGRFMFLQNQLEMTSEKAQILEKGLADSVAQHDYEKEILLETVEKLRKDLLEKVKQISSYEVKVEQLKLDKERKNI